MPNSANRSNKGGSNKGHAEQVNNNDSDASRSKPNPERSDLKRGGNENDGNPNRTSNQGRKTASGGSAE